MFVWLASYPKSGNTLIRALLSSYFFSDDGNFDFKLINNIKQFPNIKIFENLNIDINNENEVIKNYINAQKSINNKNDIQFLKTHSYLFNIKNNAFTDLNNTLGAIYIVRDPRNVVTSYANHNNLTIEQATEHIINSSSIGGNIKSEFLSDHAKVYLGSWGSNYNSWKSFKAPNKYLLIKYEDLVSKKEEIMIKVLNFIFQLKGIKYEINKKKLKNSITTTSFEKMKNKEKMEGFVESKINKKTGERIPFFNLGPKNNWQNILPINLKEKIENSFKKEMKELGYL